MILLNYKYMYLYITYTQLYVQFLVAFKGDVNIVSWECSEIVGWLLSVIHCLQILPLYTEIWVHLHPNDATNLSIVICKSKNTFIRITIIYYEYKILLLCYYVCLKGTHNLVKNIYIYQHTYIYIFFFNVLQIYKIY